MLKIITYHAREKGPKLLVLGAVHGNEKCGTVGITRVIEAIEQGEVVLQRGTLQMIPICNPRAYAADVRYTERNLNRYLLPMEKPDCYEAELGNILCPQLAACDYLLDIHSYSAGGPPFILTQAGEGNLDFARHLGPYPVIRGWAEAYARTGRKKADADANEGTGTSEYAHSKGVKSLTLECGQHKDPATGDVAYRAILRALAYLGMMGEAGGEAAQPSTNLITMTHVFYRDGAGRLAHDWKHLEDVKAGDAIAIYENGAKVTAPGDGVIIMPRAQAPLGEEWFYFGVRG